MSLDELSQISRRLERRVRDPRVVDVLTDISIADRHQSRLAK